MFVPLVSAADLGIYLSDTSVNVARAESMIADAQTLCESICNPLPPAAAIIVKRVAARGYVSTLSSRQKQMQDAGSPFGGGGTGIYLTDDDEVTLRRMAGGGGAFSINMLPADYAPVLPPWDLNGARW